jgi:hypothetical protein
MPYCPKCLSEYVEGTEVCEDCRVPLRPGAPPASGAGGAELELPRDAKLVQVRVFSGATALLDAEVARNILRAEGIPSLVQGGTAAELLPIFDVPLLVPAQEAERAAEALEAYFNSPGALPEE